MIVNNQMDEMSNLKRRNFSCPSLSFNLTDVLNLSRIRW